MRTGAGPVAGWGGGGGGALDGWEAYDATTLTPKSPYQDVRVRNLTVTGTAVITSTTTSTGQFLGANGTAAEPSYAFTNSLGTGLYRSAANAIGFSAAGTLRLTIAAGTTTLAATEALNIAGEGTIPGTGGSIGFAFSRLRFFDRGSLVMALNSGGVEIASAAPIYWGNDSGIGRSAAAAVGLYGASTAVGSSLTLASDKWLQWSGTTDPDGTYDNKIIRGGNGTLDVQNGSSQYSKMRATNFTAINAAGNGYSTQFLSHASGSQYGALLGHTSTIYIASWNCDESTTDGDNNFVLGNIAGIAAPKHRYLKGEGSRGGTDSNVAGGPLTVQPGLGTGTASGGNFRVRTGKPGATGTTANTAIDRMIVVGKPIALTDNTATSLFEIALPTLKMCGGMIIATVQVTDGTDMQSFTQTITYSAVNKAGTYTTSITAITGDKSVSGGTLANTWSILNGTNKVTIQLAADTSLTPSGTNSFVVYYTIFANCEQDITTL